MADHGHRLVPADDSERHDEPHVAGRRSTVRVIHERVENVSGDGMLTVGCS